MIGNFVKYAARRKAYSGIRSLLSSSKKSRKPVRAGGAELGPKLQEHADKEFYPQLRSIKAQLQSIDPYRFEEMVGAVWTLRGYNTDVVGESGDRGRDVIARNDYEVVAIQCKRYGPSTRVSPAEIREIAALSHRDDVTSTAMVTTSDLTEGARTEAREYSVDVYNCEDFMILIDTIGAENILSEYLPGVSLK